MVTHCKYMISEHLSDLKDDHTYTPLSKQRRLHSGCILLNIQTPVTAPLKMPGLVEWRRTVPTRRNDNRTVFPRLSDVDTDWSSNFTDLTIAELGF